MAAGECLYHMPTTSILGYCVFDAVIDLADEAATAAIEAEMAVYLNGTGANGTVVSADISESTWFKGGCTLGVYLVCVMCDVRAVCSFGKR